jgi:hypothetical protein
MAHKLILETVYAEKEMNMIVCKIDIWSFKNGSNRIFGTGRHKKKDETWFHPYFCLFLKIKRKAFQQPSIVV